MSYPYPPPNKYDPVNVTREWIRQKYDVIARVNSIKDMAFNSGIHPENVFIQPIRGNQANIFVVLGEGKGNPYLLTTHIDTVPVPDADKWVHPAFGGEIVEAHSGRQIFGRGAMDPFGSGAGMYTAVLKAYKLFRENSSKFEQGDDINTICLKTGVENRNDLETLYALKNEKIIVAFTGREESDSRGAYELFDHPYFDTISGIEGIISPDFGGYSILVTGETGRSEVKVAGKTKEISDLISNLDGNDNQTYMVTPENDSDAGDYTNLVGYTIKKESGHLEVESGKEVNVFGILKGIQDIVRENGSVVYAEASPERDDEGNPYMKAPLQLNLTVDADQDLQSRIAEYLSKVGADYNKNSPKTSSRSVAYISTKLRDEQKPEDAVSRIGKIIEQKGYSLKVRENRDFRDDDIPWNLPFKIDENDPLVQLVLDAEAKSTGKYLEKKVIEGVSDVNQLVMAAKTKYGKKVPAVLTGTTDDPNAGDEHKTDEHDGVNAIYLNETKYAEIIRKLPEYKNGRGKESHPELKVNKVPYVEQWDPIDHPQVRKNAIDEKGETFVEDYIGPESLNNDSGETSEPEAVAEGDGGAAEGGSGE